MPQPRGDERKPREEPEAEFVAAYVDTFYPNRRAIFRVSLGAIETELPTEELTAEEMAIVGRTRRWADCVLYPPPDLVIIEGALRPALGDVSTLHGYGRLLKVTPEFLDYRDQLIRLELVGCVYDPVVDQLCREQGIKYVTWTTPAALDYINRLAPRFRKSPKPSGFE